MYADCHIHMVLDGENWKAAIARHREKADEKWIRQTLARYHNLGFTYLRDGGDRWGVGKRARELAGEYGITYRTPLAPLCKAGHYGGFIGEKYENLKEFPEKVMSIRKNGADFIKIMISGLMDFDRFGVLTEPGLEPEEIRELIHIAHEEGMAVMAHANGARTVLAAAQAGVDSVEHGAYLNGEALHAMVEAGTVWVPTLSTIGNLRGKVPGGGGGGNSGIRPGKCPHLCRSRRPRCSGNGRRSLGGAPWQSDGIFPSPGGLGLRCGCRSGGGSGGNSAEVLEQHRIISKFPVCVPLRPGDGYPDSGVF